MRNVPPGIQSILDDAESKRATSSRAGLLLFLSPRPPLAARFQFAYLTAAAPFLYNTPRPLALPGVRFLFAKFPKNYQRAPRAPSN